MWGKNLKKEQDVKKRRSRELNPPKTAKKKTFAHRFFILGAIFLILCITFLIYLAVTQTKGSQYYFPRSDDIIKTETVYGERGRIFDRNGKLLVGNTENYNLIFEYGSMPDKRIDVNYALLSCIDAINTTSNASKKAQSYLPIVGSYPNYTFANGVNDQNSEIGYYYKRFLSKHDFAEELTADDLRDYFVNKYKLWDDTYTNAEISELIRLYYAMELVDFGYYQHYTIAEDINPNTAEGMALITLIKEKNIEGANFIKRTERTYPYDTYAAHILGRIGKITAENVEDYADYPLDALVGISGCEAAFEEHLRGTDGKKISVYDKEGNLIKEYYDPAPVVGKDVYLTIDIDLQIEAEDALEESIAALNYSEAGAATFIDPNNGEVLVSASYPTYSQNRFPEIEYYASLSNDEALPLLNRALQGTYAPGSVYKVGSSLAALENGDIDENTCYMCNKVYPYYGNDAPTCLGNHGSTDVTKAIQVSCNIFFYYLGEESGLDKITPYTKSLGLGVPTGVELGERAGTVASRSFCESTNNLIWRPIDNATGAIGQSYHLYTPMQLSVYMSSIVNGGDRYTAHFLKEVKNRNGDVMMTAKSQIAEKTEISAKTLSTLKNAMSLVISETPQIERYFSNVEATVGGKTGTAQISANSTLPDNALFSGFAPYDSPQIVGSCILESGEAGANASKIVAKVFEKYFTPKEEQVSQDLEENS